MKNYKLAAKRNIITAIAVILLIAVFTLWGKQLLAAFIEYWDFIGGVAVPVALLLYTNKKVYLFVQRHFVLPFRITHSDWSFLYSCITEKPTAFAVAKQSLRDAFQDIRITTDADNKFVFMEDEKVVYTLEMSEEAEGQRLTFKSSKMTTPSYQYEDKLREIASIATRIDGNSEPEAKPNFSITIEFPNKNPYFGFLIQNLPQEYIKDFKVNISLPHSDSTVMASKKEFTVNASNASVLERVVIDYLTFSPNFAKV